MPIVVAKGNRNGKRIVLPTGVHGDELSPIRAVQQIMANLDPAEMQGTVLAAYGLSRPERRLCKFCTAAKKIMAAKNSLKIVERKKIWLLLNASIAAD